MTTVESAAFNINIRPNTPTVLGMAADALGAGEWANFTDGSNPIDERLDIQWQTRWFYDPVRREGQYMGKPASGQSLNYSHYIYDEATNQWRTTGKQLYPGTGHAWSNMADTSWIVTNVDHLGVVWAITSSGSPQEDRSRLWRPNDYLSVLESHRRGPGRRPTATVLLLR